MIIGGDSLRTADEEEEAIEDVKVFAARFGDIEEGPLREAADRFLRGGLPDPRHLRRGGGGEGRRGTPAVLDSSCRSP